MTLSNDSPIENPKDDLFGLDPFALAIARSIDSTPAPAGLVLALNGSWGSGKSSAINLIKFHLTDAVGDGRLGLVNFNPWWFSGADGLILSFFQELDRAIGPSLPKRTRKSFSAIGRGVSAIGPLAAALANLNIPGLGAAVGAITGWIGRIAGTKKSLEEEHSAISRALAAQNRKFLVIIDDLDRLNPDDALTMFRLVKSVGRLPNVIYLLAFDKVLAERLVAERFPSEGPGYLEKIVQGSFEIPPPPIDLLRRQLLTSAVGVFGEPPEAAVVRFMNLFYDVVAPTIKTPRDVIRLVNNLKAAWPSVAGEVDRADFFAINAIRLEAPEIYGAIRDNPAYLCGTQSDRSMGRADLAMQYDEILHLDKLDQQEVEHWRRALKRLFPRLEAVWSNTWYTDTGSWQRSRLVCSEKHFRAYFAYSRPDGVIPADELREFLERADDHEFVASTLRKNLEIHRHDGTTRAALLLEELTIYAEDVPEVKVAPLTTALFSIADELDVDCDRIRGFGIGDNKLRLHWLLNRLVHDRFKEDRREAIYSSAMEGAAVGWCCDFAERCSRPYQPKEESDRKDGIVGEETAKAFTATAMAKIRRAASDGTLAAHRRLPGLLFEWTRLAEQGNDEVRNWTSEQLGNITFIVSMARAIPSTSYAFGMGFDGMGDRIARGTTLVDTEAYRSILDVDEFERTVTALLGGNTLSDAVREVLQTYSGLPRGSHSRVRSRDQD